MPDDRFAVRDGRPLGGTEYTGPKVYPRIGGYGAAGAVELAEALCAACPADVHGHVEVFALERQVQVRIGLLCGPLRTPWRYAVTCDPWEVATAIADLVCAVWAR